MIAVAEFQGTFDDLADINRRMVDCVFLLHFVSYNPVALVEEQDAELFLAFKAHGSPAIAQNS